MPVYSLINATVTFSLCELLPSTRNLGDFKNTSIRMLYSDLYG